MQRADLRDDPGARRNGEVAEDLDLEEVMAALTLPDDADPDEAAAIAAAVGAHLTDLERAAAAAAAEEGPAWPGRKWAFAGRLESVSGHPARVTDRTPEDPWTAAGRADRL